MVTSKEAEMTVICNSYFRDEMFRKTHKKRYTLHWMVAMPGTTVYNHLEGCKYVSDREHCVVMRGTREELWVVTLDKLIKTYDVNETDLRKARTAIMEGTESIWFKAIAKPGNTVWAARIPNMSRISIKTSWGTVLHANVPQIDHGHGDFVVCANDDRSPNGYPVREDMWIVNGAVFEDTYDMRNFK